MADQGKNNHFFWAIGAIVVVTALRMLYAQAFLLVPDETNYWQWSRHLAWGYHDQTPMIGWAIRFFTTLLGHTELAVRLPSIVAMAVGSTYLVLMAQRWYSPRIAFQTALLSQSVFAFNVGGILATADGLLGASWAAAAYHTARGYEENRWAQWCLGGFWFGFGMLSKYSMAAFLPFVFLFSLVTPIGRQRMATIRPYLGCSIGLLMFSPVVVWNASNNWNSFRHVAYLSGANETVTLHFRFLGEHLAAQAGLLTPIVFLLVCASWIWVVCHWRTLPGWIHRYLFFTSFPVFAAFTALSLHTRVYGNWPAFGYLTATVLTAGLWAYTRDPRNGVPARIRTIWKWCLGSAYVLTLLVFAHVVWPYLPIPPEADRTLSETKGWEQLGNAAADVFETMPRRDHTFYFGLNYQTASELAFYIPGNPYTVSINRWNRPNVYDYWWTDEQVSGMDGVGVLEDSTSRQRLLEIFDRVDPPQTVAIVDGRGASAAENPEQTAKRWYIYRCFGFKGGLRWIPRSDTDIRGR